MSAKRYFWSIAIAVLAVSAAYPVLVMSGQLILTLMGVPEATIMLIYLVLLLPFLPFILAVIVGLVALRRLRETGESRWWALAAALCAALWMSSGSSLGNLLMLPQLLAYTNGVSLLIRALSLVFPVTVVAFIGLYSKPTNLAPRERLATTAARAALVWLTPYALLKAWPAIWGASLYSVIGPLFGIYTYTALVAQLVATIALLFLLAARPKSEPVAQQP